MFRNSLQLVSLFSLAFTVGCKRQPPAAENATPSTAAAISVVKPEKRLIKRVVDQPGAVHAFDETTLYSKIPGYIRTLAADPDKETRMAHDRLIDIGSRVKRGQVIVELKVPELEEEYKQKKASIRQSEAEVAQAKKALAASVAGVTAMKAHVEEARAGLTRAQAIYDRWQSELTRVGRLVSGGVIDTQTRDETQNQFKSAEAGRAEAAAKVSSAEAVVAKAEADQGKALADVTAVEAKLDVAKADGRRVGALRGYTRLTAPYDGVVTRRSVTAGDFVTGDGKQGLISVARIDPVRVVVNVPEADAGLVATGQEARITLQTSTGSPVAGKVIRTSWSLEPGSRTLRTEVDLPNPEGVLRPGMYVSARLTIELPAEWSLPVAALGKANDEPVIYLAEGGKAVRVQVQLGRGDAQFTQIRRYKRPGATEWTDVTGGEPVASPAASLSDGQTLP